jgi:hypothetical protein
MRGANEPNMADAKIKKVKCHRRMKNQKNYQKFSHFSFP